MGRLRRGRARSHRRRRRLRRRLPRRRRSAFTTADLLANDDDPQGQALTVVAVSEPSNDGALTGTLATGFTYTPSNDPALSTPTTRLNYLVTDTDGHVAQGQLVDPHPRRRRPQPATRRRARHARPTTASRSSVFVTGNDFDPDGDPFSVVEVATPAHGTVAASAAASSTTHPTPASPASRPSPTQLRDTHGLLANGLARQSRSTRPATIRRSRSRRATACRPAPRSRSRCRRSTPRAQPLTWSLVTPPAGHLTGSLTGAAPTLTYTAPTNPAHRRLRLRGQRRHARRARARSRSHVLRPNVAPGRRSTTPPPRRRRRRSSIDVLDERHRRRRRRPDRRRRHQRHARDGVAATSTGVHVHARARVLRQRLVHVHDHRRLRRRRRSAPSRSRSTRRRSPRASRRRPRRSARARRRSNLADIPYERMRELDVDVSNSPFARRVRRSPGAHRSPRRSRSPRRAPRRRVRAVRPARAVRREHAAVGDPGRLSRAAGRRCWPARRSPASRRRASRSTQFLALYDPPGPPTQALRDLTLEDVSFFDGTPLAGASPAAFLIGATPVADLQFGDARRGASGWPPTPTARRPARSLGVGADDDADGARRRRRRREGPRRPPRPAPRSRSPTNLAAFVDAPVLDARLNELNLFATDIGQITVAAALDASPAVGSVRIADIPVDDSNPDDGAYGRRDLVVDCSGGFDCSARRDARPTPRPPARCAPAPRCRTSAGPSSTTPRPATRRSRWRRSPPRCRRRSTSTTSSSARSIRPTSRGRTSTSTTAGLADFARTGSTLDWNLGFSISTARGRARDRSTRRSRSRCRPASATSRRRRRGRRPPRSTR